ncbi:FadR/GntR family transcriptional regulator [Entomobacter blattae]|uniref:Transcriptional regulator NanR n=1 Tax=Entomobacter blattae TaxID=2762277 RepID=A0A7H1NRA0_9PROT|nr:FadR/GntR family transcriptional regulator [Entomobacter blattae]QNT78310.1 Transcriptional regulator NanR [Entomobacter blattae]
METRKEKRTKNPVVGRRESREKLLEDAPVPAHTRKKVFEGAKISVHARKSVHVRKEVLEDIQTNDQKEIRRENLSSSASSSLPFTPSSSLSSASSSSISQSSTFQSSIPASFGLTPSGLTGSGKTEQIILALGQHIVQGRYEVGTFLPAESELCAFFHTSRNVIREVLRSLQAKNLLTAQRFRGSLVNGPEQWNLLDGDVLSWVIASRQDERLIYAMDELRALMEPAVARWAAERAKALDLVEMEDALAAMVAHHADWPKFHQADLRFHQAILKAAYNPILSRLGVVLEALQQAAFKNTYRDEEFVMAQTLAEHTTLFEAIRHQNPDRAEQAARKLVASTTHRLREGA